MVPDVLAVVSTFIPMTTEDNTLTAVEVFVQTDFCSFVEPMIVSLLLNGLF